MKKLFLAICLITSPYLCAMEINTDRSMLPVDEKSFIEAISRFNKDEILKALGEPASKEDIKVKSSEQIVGSVWRYHNINTAEDGRFYPVTELDFLDEFVETVVFQNSTEKSSSTPSQTYQIQKP
ncbi:hypothetical protein MCEMOHM34_01124 [Candidatus Methylopumilus universalis]|uniref:hypothetical protein n=1 Tax=Candidatus Methylopumilus TaxID=1679002 RepID=UPI00111F1184|nr:hypothetical protein [Candidatus Methylopumilus planktonicus]QDD00644.1 hypothetical protein FIT68_05315 [Candidatus Methylopumilus planktonicus]QDD01975.1 hypothetical protein FIT69_05315 [Candidatus Methylopumilus planktonicus]QDD07238.1 hypothetical protein FIT67_05380 [Candidatus Methylopumilus planktonicus]QDD08567.1 hypothetical protein FIT66_05345 [Candidatus Methylopumilus planktonicus]QDD09890.1 hypothetical protein FIT65_05365 [Candidatus Methylopumilus planktonicus]